MGVIYLKSNQKKLALNYNTLKPIFEFAKKYVVAFLFLILTGFSNTITSQTYCPAAATSTLDDEIFNVTFGSLNNSSTCSTTGGAGSILNKYSNYTALSAPFLSLGSNYPLSVTIGICGSSPWAGIVSVWIDYNQNGSFADSGENVYVSPNTTFSVAGTMVSAPAGITIPFSALPGITRMRVIETESSIAPGPCTNPSYGEVEDYNVNIFSPYSLDLGVVSFAQPLGTNKCYATDTIIATLKNFGNSLVDFSVTPTILTVNTQGPSAGTYTLAINTGTIASYTSQNFTVNTSFNMNSIGTYKLKGYTTVSGDGSSLNDTTNITLTKSPMFSTSVLPNDSVCLGVPVQLNTNFSSTKQVGTGVIVNSSTAYPTPYGNFYKGARHQFLFLASELTAAGLIAGNITSLAFNVTNLNASGPYLNFNIAIATTTLTNITSFQTSGFTNYFAAASYSPTLGTNTHSLSTPFIWDGISNIIIESCYNNNPILYTNNVSVTQSSTTFTSTVWYFSDNDPTLCTSSTAVNSITQRPNISFEQPSTITYSWSPSTELSASNIANPIANVTSSRTYTVEGTIAGCMTYDTIRIYIKPTPTPNLGNDSLFCNLPVVLNSNTMANSYLWNNNAISANLNITSSGKYWVRATNANGCANTDTILVTLGTYPIVALGPDTAFCQGNTINLYVTNGPGNSYLWSTGATSTSISVGTIGTYSIIATHTSGCQSSDVINVTSKPSPNISLVFGGQKTFCPTDGNGRILSEGSPSGGTYIGSGVSGNSFYANQAGQGTHIIFYDYTAPNGCFSIAKDTLLVNACVGIEELNENISLNVYPNPNTGIFTVELNTSSDITGKISITSIDGKLVFIDTVSGNGLITKSISISDLANGIYYLKFETKDAVKTYKVLKQ